ncbi:hypothetical protein FB107DRAFT_287407 [Schizophyllum commune]
MSSQPEETPLRDDAPEIASFDTHFTPPRLPSRQIIQLSRISLGLAAASLIYSAIHILAYGRALTLNLLAGGACAAFQSLILISASRQVRSTHAHAVITHRWFISPYETRSVLALGSLALLWFVVFVLGIARRTAVASPIARFSMFIPNIAAGVEAVMVGHMAVECYMQRRQRGVNYASEGQADEDIDNVKSSFRDRDASQTASTSYLSSYLNAIA